MIGEMVLNEASLPFDSQQECIDNLDVFFSILHQTKSQNVTFARVDDIEGSWDKLVYADDFSFGHWLNSLTDIDLKRQIQSVLTSIKCPLRNIDDNVREVTASNMLFLLSSDESVEVLGLGFASLNNCHGLSFSSKEHWTQDLIKIKKQWDDNSVVIEEYDDVSNICTREQVDIFLRALENEKQQNRSYFNNIRTEGNTDFPNLLFTESVLKVFRSTTLSAIDYRDILNALNQLNGAILNSNSLVELVAFSKLRISGESPQTMGRKPLRNLRTFKHPELGSTVFEDHVKNFVGARRMHIFSNYKDNKICIGYFGNHLKTVST